MFVLFDYGLLLFVLRLAGLIIVEERLIDY